MECGQNLVDVFANYWNPIILNWTHVNAFNFWNLFLFVCLKALWSFRLCRRVDQHPHRGGTNVCLLLIKWCSCNPRWLTEVLFQHYDALLLNIYIGDTDSALTLLFSHSWHGCAVLSESHFLVHGGYNGNDALSDTFIFNTGETRCSSYCHFISRFVFLADKWPLHQVQCPYLLNAPFHEVLESLISWPSIKQHVQSFCNYF